MPANKRPRDRQEKRDEIVTAARRLYVDAGYDATSMSRLAAEAGVAANTVYWYFTDKDDVLIAVLDTLVEEALLDWPNAPTGLAGRMLWLIDRLSTVSKLVSTVHARTTVSESIDAWHHRFHTTGEAMLRAEIHRPGLTPTELDAAVRLCVFTIEGLLVHPHAESEKRAICETLQKSLC
ncbi:TetR/AcrR family transcriptional regulator [Nocardia sp. NBC_01377]|uniref:TetR/AcrR family transcriptional regulator n=1 Tax=Nocardia TaxID=1817 RepID=UPI001C224AC7|nr:TetR/AcrR family transcriptional regulator [Nocardia noduli]